MKLFRFVVMVSAFMCLIAGVLAADQKTGDLYKSKCQGCHGPDGKATAVGKKLGARDFQNPDVAKMSEAELVSVTTDGKNKMPPYKGKLTDDQIKALVNYIKEMK